MRTMMLFVVALLVVGCDESGTSTTTATPPRPASAAPPPPPPPPGGAPEELDSEPEPKVDREVARTGVGKKGRNYGGGVISEPVRQYFRAQQQIQFIKVTSAMNLYKGEHGFLPKTHDVFMKEIIEANEIELPELPEGLRYVYDPERGELMVEKPRPG